MGSCRSFLSRRVAVVIFWRGSPMGVRLTMSSSAPPPRRIEPVHILDSHVPIVVAAGSVANRKEVTGRRYRIFKGDPSLAGCPTSRRFCETWDHYKLLK